MSLTIHKFQDELRSCYAFIKELDDRMAKTTGEVREAYALTLSTEIRRLCNVVDAFKMSVCSELVSIEAKSIIDVSRFPTMTDF
jgi:hypothetical protein